MEIEVPDLINGRNFEYFKKWEGGIRFLLNIKLKRVTQKNVEDDVDCDEEESEEDTIEEELDNDSGEESDKMGD